MYKRLARISPNFQLMCTFFVQLGDKDNWSDFEVKRSKDKVVGRPKVK